MKRQCSEVEILEILYLPRKSLHKNILAHKMKVCFSHPALPKCGNIYWSNGQVCTFCPSRPDIELWTLQERESMGEGEKPGTGGQVEKDEVKVLEYDVDGHPVLRETDGNLESTSTSHTVARDSSVEVCMIVMLNVFYSPRNRFVNDQC